MHELVWYYAATGPGGVPSQVGPVSERHLRDLIRAGQVRHATLVWTEGMSDWRPVRELRGLAEDLPAAPPTSAKDVPYMRLPPRGDSPISTENVPALLACYGSIIGGVFSLLIWGSGLLIAPVGLLLGVWGRWMYRKDPGIGGAGHAMVGIVISLVSLIVHALIAAIIALAVFAS